MNEIQGEHRMLDISEIQVPELRVTSQFDAELLAELEESISRQGVLQPVQVMAVDGKFWLIDGWHRIAALKRLGQTQVPALVRPGTPREVIMQNLVVNRQRGKTNPAEEAKLIRRLREDEGMPLEAIAQLTGISIGWARKLHDISYLAPTVLELIGGGKLGVTHAMELLKLPDESLQIEVAQQAVEWKYTVEQVRFRVVALMQPETLPKPGGVQFDPRGAPSQVPIPCYVCHRDLTGSVSYLWMCGDCQALINQFLQAYNTPPPAPEPEKSTAPPAVATESTTAPAQGA